MDEIEKRHDHESQNFDIKTKNNFSGIEKSRIILLKISPFRMKKLEINGLIRYETFFQRSVFEMSHFDIA